MEGLDSLLKLELLELGSNRIRNVVGIEQLTNLKELWLGKNKLTSMVSLKKRRPSEFKLECQGDSDFMGRCPGAEKTLLLSEMEVGEVSVPCGRPAQGKVDGRIRARLRARGPSAICVLCSRGCSGVSSCLWFVVLSRAVLA